MHKMTGTIKKIMRRHFGTSPAARAGDSTRGASTFPQGGEAEQHPPLEWNDTFVDYAEKDHCLHQLIEQQAERNPGWTAVVFEQRKLTYAELDRRANQLAQCLRVAGVGPETTVGVFVGRSLEMIVGILGILKAGGAYVPIDTSFPRERISFILGDAKVALLVTQSSLLGNLPASAPQTICLDGFDWKGSGELAHGVSGVRPENLAYVIYTSGSTGHPKGVCIEHRHIVNYVLGAVTRYQFKAGMSHAMVSTIAADLGNTVMFSALATGGCLHVISEERAQSYTGLSEYFEHKGIDVLKIVPSHLAALQASGDTRGVMPRRSLVLGGEALRLDWTKQLKSAAPGCEIYNEYGPTETTVGVVVYQVSSRLPDLPSGMLPSGRPMSNSRAYILDPQGKPVPVGVAGEIHIGGSGVGRGYLNRPDLTAERFLPDPFSLDGAGRMYRTGDRGRYLADGNIEFLGRVDHQVKIRGYRIELGEIEQAIRDCQGVRDVVVVAGEEGLGNKELVAYVVPERSNQSLRAKGDPNYPPPALADETVLNPSTLRKFLKQRLPHYMVPSAFVLMEKLPLTPNGKVDRQALPAPEALAEVPGEYVAPRDVLEQSLAGIWAKALKVERVGIHDDFFDLGGHSLLAVRVIAEFEKLSGKRLPLTMLLQAPTIVRLAELLRDDSRDPGWSSLVPIQAHGSKAPLFLAHEGNGSVMLYKQLARHLGEDQPVYGLQSQGLKGDGSLHRTIEEMASRYIQEVKRVQPRGPYYLGGYCMGGTVALEMALQLGAQGENVALVVMIDTYNLSLIRQARLRRLQFLHMLQSAWFHVVNFASPKNVERWRFLQHKWEIAGTSLGIRLQLWLDKLGGLGKPAKSGSDVFLRVTKVNHQAMKDYVPRPYSGKVLLIRSKGHFWGEDDQMLGWGEGFCSQLDVRKNLARPKGIMLDPYLRMLAQDLKAYLEEVKAAETASAAEPVEEETSQTRALLDSDQMAKLMAGLPLALLCWYLAFSM